MEKIKAPRGTQDILPAKSATWQFVESQIIKTLHAAGFAEIRTPIFEATNLFSRAVGEDTDIVNKEMYTFMDKGDRSMTLRPEGTAGVVRSYIENSLERGQKPLKLWYQGPMFRYERPQTGRYRQFHQIGVEALGSAGPAIDVEVIIAGMQLLENIGLKNLTLYINSIGSSETRKNYREVLKDFLAPLQGDVCDDCKRRYEQNPLRALDCKIPEDQKLYADAPQIVDHLDAEAKKFWDELRASLDQLGVNYKEDPNLVRGLDYYSHTVFEIKADDPSLGQQSTVLAGGRYDDLITLLGGKETPAVGWALGLERLTLLKEAQGDAQAAREGVYIVSDDVQAAQKFAQDLRLQTDFALTVEFDFENAKMAKQIDKADKRNARYVVFFMGDERKAGSFTIKDLASGEQEKDVSLEKLIDKVTAKEKACRI